ncbi:MAG TPA: RNA-binding protein [Acidobacteriota bacterium]|nr:RNA-binding protein [Acidobacteriota bacterium]
MNRKKLYVGGLSFSTTEQQLEELFASHGTVESARIITDRATGRSRGFGFVEMSDISEAEDAAGEINGTEFDGRTLTVDEAKPRGQSRSSSNSPAW